MILANLRRRKGRTILTLLGISIGIAAIVSLGAMAAGIGAGFTALAQGSEADYVLSQSDALSALLSRVEVSAGDVMRTWPEVEAVDGVMMSNALLEDGSYVFLFGYDPAGFAVAHFRIVEGQGLGAVGAREVRGRPLLLGRRAAERLGREVGDTLRFEHSTYRIVGIYETGDAFEDGSAVVELAEAQALVLQPRHVAMLYVQVRDPSQGERLREKVARQFPELSISEATAFGEQEDLVAILDAVAMSVAGLAVVIGAMDMGNTLLMSILERTREIGVLRALGWRRRRVIAMIVGESTLLSLMGAGLGSGLGVAGVYALGRSATWVGALGGQLSPGLFGRALGTALALGICGGAYPAWWASRLLPVEALRYEGGAGEHTTRVPGVMALRNLLRRRTRTVFAVMGTAISIASIVALGAVAEGGGQVFSAMWRASKTDLLAVEGGADADLSAIHERVGAQIQARPEVDAVSGAIMTAVNTEQMAMLLVLGYHPRSFAIRHFRIVEGQPLAARREVIVGKAAAQQMGLHVGDTLRLLQSNFRVAGIFETGVTYEEVAVVIGMREAQALTGKPRQVMYYAIKLSDPSRAEAMRDTLGAVYPELNFILTAEVAEGMSDFRMMQELIGQISFLAVLIGAVGMLNSMLMSVLERTREIGVLRALGWRRRRVLGMIVQESLILGLAGGAVGIGIGTGMASLLRFVPGIYGAIEPVYTPQLFVQAILVALIAGVAGGLYPAWRATRMRPVEALRYE